MVLRKESERKRQYLQSPSRKLSVEPIRQLNKNHLILVGDFTKPTERC